MVKGKAHAIYYDIETAGKEMAEQLANLQSRYELLIGKLKAEGGVLPEDGFNFEKRYDNVQRMGRFTNGELKNLQGSVLFIVTELDKIINETETLNIRLDFMEQGSLLTNSDD